MEMNWPLRKNNGQDSEHFSTKVYQNLTEVFNDVEISVRQGPRVL